MAKKWLLILTACFLFFSFAKVKPAEKDKINWLTLPQLKVKLNEKPRPVLIDLYTNWCYWCKVMDKKTYNNSKVIAYINEHFYAVKVDAETKSSIEWNNKNYSYNSSNKVNDFALYITNGEISFPTTVIFSEIEKQPASVPGYMSPKKIESVLKYFGEGLYKSMNYEEFSKSSKETW